MKLSQEAFKKILLFLLVCAFFILSPFLVLYSLGYRIDWSNKKLLPAGALFIKTTPGGATVILEGKGEKKTSYFRGGLLWSFLPPKRYSLTIKKEGYISYRKEIEIFPGQTTAISHIVLWKKKENASKEKILDRVLSVKRLGDTLWALRSAPTGEFSLFKVTENDNPVLFYAASSPFKFWPLKKDTLLLGFEDKTALLEGKRAFELPLVLTEAQKKDDSALFLLDKRGDLYLFSLADKSLQKVEEGVLKIWVRENKVWYLKGERLLSWKGETLGNILAKDMIFSGDTLFVLDIQGRLWRKTTKGFWERWKEVEEGVEKIYIDPSGSFLVFIKNRKELWTLFLRDVSYPAKIKKGEKRLLWRDSEPILSLDWLTPFYVLLHKEGGLEVLELDLRFGPQRWKLGDTGVQRAWKIKNDLFILKQDTLFRAKNWWPSPLISF